MKCDKCGHEISEEEKLPQAFLLPICFHNEQLYKIDGKPGLWREGRVGDVETYISAMRGFARYAFVQNIEAEKAVIDAMNLETKDPSPGKIEIQVGRELFRFESLTKWVNYATFMFANCGVCSCDVIAINFQGRICSCGDHFMRADRENTYPIRVYAIGHE